MKATLFKLSGLSAAFLLSCSIHFAVTTQAASPGSVVAWGANFYGQGTTPAEAQSGVTAIAAGHGHNVGLKTDGRVLVWGWNFFGQTDIPEEARSGVVAIAAGPNHSLVLKQNGSVLSWGNGLTYVPLAAQSGVTAIAAGASHTVALLGGGGTVPLSAKSSGNQLVVAWPTNAAGLTLQSTLNLTPPVTWTDVTMVPVLLGAQWTVTNSLSGSNTFYRLRKP